MDKQIKCKSCGEEISPKAKVCPKCGAKNSKPLYKKWWFWVIIGVLVILVAVPKNKSDDKVVDTNADVPSQEENQSVDYVSYSVSELFDDLHDNALKAEEKYNNLHVELTGRLSTIDSDGKYISLQPENESFTLDSITCYIKSKEQKQKIMEMSTGDIVTLRGKIKRVGEILGYSLDIDEINN